MSTAAPIQLADVALAPLRTAVRHSEDVVANGRRRQRRQVKGGKHLISELLHPLIGLERRQGRRRAEQSKWRKEVASGALQVCEGELDRGERFRDIQESHLEPQETQGA